MRSTLPILPPGASLTRLAAEVERLESRDEPTDPPPDLALGWPGPDTAIGGGLRWGALHEGISGAAQGDDQNSPSRQSWPPALSVLSHIGGRALRADTRGRCAVWVGRRVWPYGPALGALGPLLARSLFIAPGDLPQRVWAIDLALRCQGVGVVIADGSGFGMSETRRLQLAASNTGALCLLARPWPEHKHISAAWTRWSVAPTPSDTTDPRWNVELLRCKGMRPTTEEARRWSVQRAHETDDVRETGDVRLVPGVQRGRDQATRPALRAFG